MKYYLHDSSSFNDEKITELYLEFGYEGLGLFYTILEKLAMQEKPIKTKVLKHQLNVGKKLEKCWSFMEEIDLISTNNGETFNKQLLNFSQKYQVSKEKNAKRIAEWRENQSVSENVTRYEHVSNTPKVNKSKVKESKVNNSKVDFNEMLLPHANDLGPEYMNFAMYWMEQDEKGRERWQSEKFFDIKRRITTWMNNASKFTSNKPQQQLGKLQQNMISLKNVHDQLTEEIQNGTFVNPYK
jgi:hypothetical protein